MRRRLASAWWIAGGCLLVLVSRAALAQDGGSGFSDRVEAHALIGLRAGLETDDGSVQTAEIEVVTELAFDLWSGAELAGITRIRADRFDKLEPGVPSQAEIASASRRVIIGDRSEFELRELRLRTELGPAFLTLGKQQIVWGHSDGLKVLDIVNPQDFREFILADFDDSRIPLWAVTAEVPVGAMTTQFVWVPDRSYHLIPRTGAAYAFSAPGFTLPPAGVDLVVEEVKRPGRPIRDSDVGVRVSGAWRGWDLGANYLYHYDDFVVPFVRTEVTPVGPRVVVTPGYVRTHLVGGTFSNAFGSVVLRGEIGYFFDRPLVAKTIVDDGAFLQRDQLRHVVGVDWYRFSETLVSVQLFQDWVPQHSALLFADRVDTSISVLLRRELMNDTLSLQAIAIYNGGSGSGLIRPRVAYLLNDYTTVEVGGDWFYGDDDDLFGQFTERNRVVLALSWAF